MKQYIKSFEIIGLFGTDDVKIPFDQNVKILIGENGLGKTQVLNIFYYTLTKNFLKLRGFNFKELKLTFANNTIVHIKKTQIDQLVDSTYNHPSVQDLIREIGHTQFDILYKKFSRNKKNTRIFEENLYTTKLGRKIPIHRIFRIFDEYEMSNQEPIIGSGSDLNNCKKNIDTELQGLEVIYFPTYRRVEEDLHNLGYNEEEISLEVDNASIQFGMDDVQKKFETIENSIDKLLKEGLAQFSKDILDIVIDENAVSNIDLKYVNEGDIEIILSRVGSQLSDEQKRTIKGIVANKQVTNPLSVYLLRRLIEIYEKQKELDNSIKIFRDVCNKYLINKNIFYDESAIEIYITSERTETRITLDKLSSGEKQIISMFSKIYLPTSSNRFIVLFDEPELSLSILWQKQLLPDILNSKKCDFLLAVTHSPFIFDNELDQYAIGLNEYIDSPYTRD